MKKIIIEKRYGNKYDDVMYTIANDENLIRDLEWGFSSLMFAYDDQEAENCNLAQYLEYISDKIEVMDKSSKEYQNLSRFMKQRNLFEYGMELRDEFDLVFSQGVFDKVIEILSDKDVRDKFIDYSNNKEIFYVRYPEDMLSESGIEPTSIRAIYPKSMSIDIFIKIMTSMFGAPNKSGKLDNQRLYSQFYIPGIEEYKKAYLEMYEKLDFEKYIPKDYRFKECYVSSSCSSIINNDSEPSWNLNDEVRNGIYEGMPDDLSLEEKAIYVYYKLCQIFLYDEGYMYRDKIQKVNYTNQFSKEHLEGIIPGDKITCYDFSRIYSKLINEMNEEIEGVVISTGINNGHFLAGFSTKKGAVELEGINTSKSEESGETANDILRAKLGQKLAGIRTVHGQDEIFVNANKKISQMFSQQHVKSETEMLVEKIKQEQDEELPQDFELCVKSLIANMKKIGISGNEFSMVFNNVLHKGFFGDDVDCAYIGTTEELDNKEERYKRIICICKKENEEFKFYLLDTDSLQLVQSSEEEIKNKLDSNEFVYENDDRKINALNR